MVPQLPNTRNLLNQFGDSEVCDAIWKLWLESFQKGELPQAQT